jgi:hypothetical protein
MNKQELESWNRVIVRCWDAASGALGNAVRKWPAGVTFQKERRAFVSKDAGVVVRRTTNPIAFDAHVPEIIYWRLGTSGEIGISYKDCPNYPSLVGKPAALILPNELLRACRRMEALTLWVERAGAAAARHLAGLRAQPAHAKALDALNLIVAAEDLEAVAKKRDRRG